MKLIIQDVKRKPLWYHTRGLMQTATGYGPKIVTEYMLRVSNRWHRVYCSIYSNSGTLYILKGGDAITDGVEDAIQDARDAGRL